jgi:mannose-6-phosphate isomerase-like protein (cupin superfamily)
MDIIHVTKEKGEEFKILGETERSQVGIMTIGPSDDSGAAESHTGDQVIYIIDGEAEVEMDGEKEKLSEGDCVIIPAGKQHHIVNNGMETLHIFSVYAPPSY